LKREEMMAEDVYVKMQKQMMGMPVDKVMMKMEELKKMCTWPQCPTNNECAKNAKEILFCSTGRRFHCITENKGFLCPGCPVAKQMGLTYQSFCLMGNEKAPRFDAMLKM
jgi:hypothetical protein